MKQTIRLDLPNEQASEALAKRFACYLKAPLVLAFSGDLGAGKTTFIRAMLRNLGVTTAIKSPTYSLVETYFETPQIIHHFDLYRIHHEDELDYLGFRDYFCDDSICCIEWAEKAGKALPRLDIHFKLKVQGVGRQIECSSSSPTGQLILLQLQGEL